MFEHVGRATFPTSVLTVKPFGKIVICGATSGYQLDFDVRYLWMRQKQIIGSHFANAYEATRANELIESGKIRPVLWKTMTFDGVAEAHQSMYKNEHLGKIAILVGAEAEGLGAHRGGPGCDPRGGRCLMAGVVHIPWYATVFRGDQFEAALEEIAPLALRYGATRVRRLPVARRRYKFLQLATFEDKADFDRYWYGEEFSTWRARLLGLLPGAGPVRLARPGGAARSAAGSRRSSTSVTSAPAEPS